AQMRLRDSDPSVRPSGRWAEVCRGEATRMARRRWETAWRYTRAARASGADGARRAHELSRAGAPRRSGVGSAPSLLGESSRREMQGTWEVWLSGHRTGHPCRFVRLLMIRVSAPQANRRAASVTCEVRRSASAEAAAADEPMIYGPAPLGAAAPATVERVHL